VYWVSLDPTQGHEVQKRRPCVVVSPEAMHGAGMAVVCPCTTKLHPRWPYRIQVHFNGRDNEIMPDQIRAVSLKRFGDYLCTLEPSAVTRLREVIARLYTV
jgi:mRNA interferase MazF